MFELDDMEHINKIDLDDMSNILDRFPEQVEAAIKISREASIFDFSPKIICIGGMGSSAISGDITYDILSTKINIPILVNRAHTFPQWVDDSALVFIESYSGNTEESIAMFQDALKRGSKIVCITSGGKLERLAQENRTPLIKIPSGYPPRTAVGYLLVSILITLDKLGIYDFELELKNAVDTLKELREEINLKAKSRVNIAKKTAVEIANKIPIIYGHGIYSGVAKRWVTQLNENAKMLSWSGNFPEMTHNEIVGWHEANNLEKFIIILLRDHHQSDQIKNRMDITKKFLEKKVKTIEFYAKGEAKLSRIFYSLYAGDYISFYAAILRGVNPTPVEIIERVKKELSERRGGDFHKQ